MYPRLYKNLFEVMVMQINGLFVKIFVLHPVLSTREGYWSLYSAIEENLTYTSGVLDLFLPLKHSGKALLSMAWTLQRKKKPLSNNTEYKKKHFLTYHSYNCNRKGTVRELQPVIDKEVARMNF